MSETQGQGSRAASEAALARLLDMAMKNVVEKLSAMLKVPITISDNRVGPLEEGLAALSSQRQIHAVLFNIRGEAAGGMMIGLARESMADFCGVVPADLKEFLPDDDKETARFLFEETGNLIFSTYLDVFSDISGLRLLPTPPSYALEATDEVMKDLRQRIEARPGVPDDGPRPGLEALDSGIEGICLLLSYLANEEAGFRIRVAVAFTPEDLNRILLGARQCMPDVFLL